MSEVQAAGEPAPLALQLAVRVEKIDPPTTPAICAAAALATIALLDDQRSRPEGDWHGPVSAWNGAKIRKIVRRGRGSAWVRAQEIDGVTVARAGAEVRAFVPGPLDQVPRPVAKLQIQSTPLEDVPRIGELGPVAGLVVAVTPEVDMTWGKQAAQCAHAAQRAWLGAEASERAAWDAAGRPLSIIHPDRELWDRLLGTATVKIRDAGYTEIPAGTNTTLAYWA